MYADMHAAVASAGPGAVTAVTSTAAYLTTANILPLVGFGTLGVNGCESSTSTLLVQMITIRVPCVHNAGENAE